MDWPTRRRRGAAVLGYSGVVLSAAAVVVASPPLVACVSYPIVLSRDILDDRSTVAPLAVAPIPPAAVRAADLSVRQLYATLVDGADDTALGSSATGRLRTDFVGSVRLSRFAGFRILGSLDYGDASAIV